MFKKIIEFYPKLSFASRILLWMFVGAVLGIIFGEKATIVQPIGDIFLQLLILAAIPLVFFNLLAGISSMGSTKQLGGIGIKVILYYLTSTVVAITVGLTVINWLDAGKGMNITGEVPEDLGEMPSITKIIMDMIPTNIFKSFAEGELIQIVIFAVLLGVVTVNLSDAYKGKFQKAFSALALLMRKLVEFILRASPLGFGALMAATFGEYGSQLLGPLAIFIGGIYIAQSIMVIFYMSVLKFIGGISPIWFLRETSSLYATTAATCSSLASLAVSMEIAEEKLKLPEYLYSFTLPLGAQFNKDGTSIMLAGVLIFTAEAAGIEMGIAQMVQVVIIGLILSEGSTGIPGGGLVVAMLFAEAFSLPLEIVAVVGGIYRLIDMGNTTINCMGDMMITVVLARLEEDWSPKSKNKLQPSEIDT